MLLVAVTGDGQPEQRAFAAGFDATSPSLSI